MIPFGQWSPDLADLNNSGSIVAQNVLPHAQGYVPFPSVETFGDTLTAYARGAFYARDKGNNVYVYAGDETMIKELQDGTWMDVTRSGDAYACGSTDGWEMIQWDQTVIATNFADEIQVATFGDANFVDLGGTPPQAKHITTARNFIIVGNCNDVAGDGLVPNRVHWSGLNNPATWTPSATTQADYEDIKTGGWVQRIFGGEYAVVFLERSIYRMSYIGTPAVWQFDEVAPGTGLVAGNMAAQVGDDVYFLSPRGFYVLRDGSNAQAIGNSKIDEYVLSDLNTALLHLCSASIDNKTQRVYFCYPGMNSTAADRVVVYDYHLDRWSYTEQAFETIVIAAQTGYTMDGVGVGSLDDLAGDDLDSLLVSLDDSIYTGGRGQLAVFDSNHNMGFLTGPPLTATIETGEVQLSDDKRTLLTAVRPVVDGGTTTIQAGHRNLQSNDVSWTLASTPTSGGRCNIRKNARYFRFRSSITGTWTHALGVEPEGAQSGWR